MVWLVRRLVLMSCLGCVAAIATSCSALSGGDCRQEPPTASAGVPDSFVVAFETSRGRFDAVARKAWAPMGVAHFYTLVRNHYYDGSRFFRVVQSFVAQFGIAGDPKVYDAWKDRCLADEPVRHTNSRGTIAYARGGPGTRSVQLFVNLRDNPQLDRLSGFGFPPIGEVVSGMNVVDSLYSGYGDAAPPSGPEPEAAGPSQDSLMARGNAYLAQGWPKLDFIKTAHIVREWPARPSSSSSSGHP